MTFKFLKINFFPVVLLSIFYYLFSILFFASSSFGAVLRPDLAKDTLANSSPGVSANHVIQFRVPQAVPPSGKIIITPETDAFLIPVAFNLLDMDFAVAPSYGEPYADRTIAALPNGGEEGVAIQTGYSGSLTFTLNSSSGLSAGNVVQIELGTNAAYGANGTNQLINGDAARSYKIFIETRNASDVAIDSGGTMIAIVKPITVGPIDTTDRTPPVLANGMPTGLLMGGTKAVELSLETDEFAYCRYATTTGVDFTAMTATFPTKTKIGSTPAYSHYNVVVTGLVDSTTYSFYVRCRDYQMNKNMEDYVLSFKIGVVPSGDIGAGTGTGTGTGSGSGSGSGGGSGDLVGGGSGGSGPGGAGDPGGGNFLKTADVSIRGTAYPYSKVYILLDGKEKTAVTSGADGKFIAGMTGLERGTYTFGMYAIDSFGAKSVMINSTVSLIANTMNTVSGILFPPTIHALNKTINPGENFVFSGRAMPKSAVEVFLRAGSGAERFATSTADTQGLWTVEMNTDNLSVGAYTAGARSSFSKTEMSGWSAGVSLGIGQEAAADLSLRSDMNNDNKVNLVDFSILLFSWGTSDAKADINADGKVNLSDFSILIFYWTG